MKNNRRGSAYLIALGVLGVLVIVFLTFSSSSRSRRWSTRFTSAESKAEALAEAAVELGLRLVRNDMNLHNDPTAEWYGIFRAPAPMVNGGLTLGTAGGDDLPLNLTTTPACYSAQTWTIADKLAPLQGLVTDIPGSITVVVDTVIAGASAIAAKSANYHVVGVNKKSIGVNYQTGGFLDNSQSSPSVTYGLLSGLISDYRLNFRLPGNAPSYNETVSISIPIPLLPDLDVPVTITKMSPAPCDDFEVIASILGFEFKMQFHVYPEYLRQYLEGPSATTTDFSVPEFAKNFAMKPPNWVSYQWGNTSKVTNSFSGAYSALPAPTLNAIGGAVGFQSAMAVEKVGNLRLTATVHYQPQIGGRTIKRVLSAERDFKVSDCQPVAPEYVFFIANSDQTYENPATKLYSDAEYAENCEIKFVNYPSSAMAVATSAIHTLAKDPADPNATPTYNILTDSFGTGSASDAMHLPGMIRINGTTPMKTNVFLGCLEEIFTSEYNLLAMQKTGTPSKEELIDPRFEKLGGAFSTFQLPHISFSEYAPSAPGVFTGFQAMFDVYKLSSTLSPVAPMLFFGNFGGEYPLSLNVEANLKQRFSEIGVKIKPAYDGWELMQGMDIKFVLGIPSIDGFDSSKVDWTKADKTIVKMSHQWKERPYGMTEYPPQGGPWDPTKPECLPANLYSPMQYAKKATYYYETAAEFQADVPNRTQGGIFDCSGVTFIKTGNVQITFAKVKGHGLIVSNHHITVKTNIKRDGPPGATSLGLIARLGRITFQGGITNVEAACYSNFTPLNSSGGSLKIDGNMVVNHFKRTEFNNFHVYYNGPGCRVSLLSIARDVGKYEPKRYHVAIGKQWARFEYEKQ